MPSPSKPLERARDFFWVSVQRARQSAATRMRVRCSNKIPARKPSAASGPPHSIRIAPNDGESAWGSRLDNATNNRWYEGKPSPRSPRLKRPPSNSDVTAEVQTDFGMVTRASPRPQATGQLGPSQSRSEAIPSDVPWQLLPLKITASRTAVRYATLYRNEPWLRLGRPVMESKTG